MLFSRQCMCFKDASLAQQPVDWKPSVSISTPYYEKTEEECILLTPIDAEVSSCDNLYSTVARFVNVAGKCRR